jgi:hypothetical protein
VSPQSHLGEAAPSWLAVANWALQRGGLGPVAAHCVVSAEDPQHQWELSEPEWTISAADGEILVRGCVPLSQIPDRQLPFGTLPEHAP